MIWVWLLLGLVAVAIVASVLFLCLPYWRSPEKHWRDGVLRAYQAARQQVMAEENELRRLGQRRQVEEQALTQKALQHFLTSISVNELEAYPGIGPVTITRLLQADYRNLGNVQNARIRIPGLGKKRLADLGNAVRKLTREAEGRFRAGGCREAQELAGRIEALATQYQELEWRARARAKAAADVGRQLERAVAVARQVTFWRFFWKDAQVVVPPELLRGVLPDLGAALASAERKAEAASRANQRITATPRPEPKPHAATVPVAETPTKAPAAPVEIADWMTEENPASTVPASRGTAPASLQAVPTPAMQRPAPGPQPSTTEAILEATVEFAFAVARADGRLARAEKALIVEELEGQYGHDPALLNYVKAYCAHFEAAAIDVGSCVDRIKNGFPPAQRTQLFEFAVRTAEASGSPNEREVRFLERVAREWAIPWTALDRRAAGFIPAGTSPPARPTSELNVDQPAVMPKPAAPPVDPRAVLEIDRSVPLTADLIRRQYNLLSARLAPEKAQAMGAEFVAMAESKRAAIRAAAETLLQPLGEPLEQPEQQTTPAELRHNPDLDAMFGA